MAGITSGKTARTAAALALATGLAACGGTPPSGTDYVGGPSGRLDPFRDRASVFGDGGLDVNNLRQTLSGSTREDGDALPVNKYLWQASLDTLSFLPLASTDPFTGVIATDWGATPEAPGERFKVTAYMLNSDLAASSLKVAVYRETRNADGLWVPTAVDPETARKLEDAILTRARQIRIAATEAAAAG